MSVVTSAGRGIGRAITLAYAQAGAAVVCSARSSNEIDETVTMVEATGGTRSAVGQILACGDAGAAAG